MQLEILHQSKSNSKKQSILFLHGMWHGAWCWEPHFMPYFSELGYNVYAMSLRNHAGSEQKGGIWKVRMKDYVEDLRQAVESVEGNPILIGHSMGGFIVQKYLEKYDAPSVVLLASVPPQGIIAPTLKVLKTFPFTFLKANLTVNLTHIIANKENAKHLLFSDDISDAELTEYHSKMGNEAYLGYIEMLGLSLPKVNKMHIPPMLVVGAENDAVVSKINVEKTAKRYHADMKMIPNVAHDVMLDVHWKDVADAVADWLE